MRIVDVAGYEGIYAVDEMGNVYSYKYGKVKNLKAIPDRYGYLTVTLRKDGIQKLCRIHRLMAKAFLSSYLEELDVDHIDRNRANNKLSNLRMLPKQQNSFNTSAKGYYWNKVAKKFHAYIKKDGKDIYLGLFDKEEDAREAYLAAKQIYHVIT
jgi:hypothetical protein